MIFAALIDLLLALILHYYGPKQEATRWAVFFFVCTCLGSLSYVIEDSIMPALQLYKLSNPFVDTVFFNLHIACFFILQACVPYAFILFSIVYSEVVIPRIKKMLVYSLTLPIIVTLFITPLKPDIEINYPLLLIWAAPYYLIACFLLIYSYLKEKNPVKRRSRFIIVCFAVPPIIVIVILNNFERAFNQNDQGVRYISIFVGIAFVVFIFSAIRYGALGVRIKFEKQRLDQSIKGIASGTSMLNHAIKNRITNIDMLVDRMKEISQSPEQKRMDEDIALIQLETQQMMQIVKRIQQQIEDIELEEGVANLIHIMTMALQSNYYLLENKGVFISTDYFINIDLVCDKVHLQEVFNNLIRNVVDAVEPGMGKLSIRIYENKSNVLIVFSDNGSGIDKDAVSKIFVPFFSTKHREDNFGLGLSYCYLVIQKHGGKIDVTSKEESGTTFTVRLPKFRKVYSSSQ
ncbi:MAG: Histidine kinase, gyrase and HSP90-like ATPase [Bacilli bacterium]|nr:Histidine kinase, gyrase and HSP90-like ATPase [Bacilli bacterium]